MKPTTNSGDKMARYQVELANKVSKGRTVGNLYVVTRRPEGLTTILASFNTREQAEEWIKERTA